MSSNLEKVFKKVAKQNNAPINEIKAEIQKSIEDAKKSTESEAKEFWQKIDVEGASLEKVVSAMADAIKNK